MKYSEFLAGKIKRSAPSGIEPGPINPYLYGFQSDIAAWALRRGKAAIFADCGLGKTPIQLEWARQLIEQTGARVLILAPLAVSCQTVKEAEKMGIPARLVRTGDEAGPGINVTNYEMLHRFNPKDFQAVVLDESSILKSYDSVYRKALSEFASTIPYRLCCTATPAPNDLVEIINHAEFLGVMRGKEIIALYFRQDGNTTHAWRLKGHARKDFWKWVASWAVAVTKPSDIGHDDGPFILPELRLHDETIVQERGGSDYLFPMPGVSLVEQRANRRATIEQRVEMAVKVIASDPDSSWLIWCELNDESALASKALNAVEVKGADTPEKKESALIGFADGTIKRMVTKPTIAGFGMNFQVCHKVIFLGMSHSYEQYYQAVRRVWRFGQKMPVDCHLIVADTDGAIKSNVERKEREARKMMDEIILNMRDVQLERCARQDMVIEETRDGGEGWEIRRGDCVKLIKEVPDNSIGLTVFSPPFPGMYAYTNSPADIGNTESIGQMMDHFGYIIPDLLRVTMPGRMCCIHLCQVPAFLGKDGYIGIKDFRGRVIAKMENEGWIYYGEVTIDKNPQVAAVRTKERGLLFKSLATDAAMMRMALADYVIYFRKPGDNPEPIKAGISKKYSTDGSGWITQEQWIEWAAPVWYRKSDALPGGINQTEVLSPRPARENDDEKHLCPLQLGVIERCVKLWSNPGDLILSPFAGIGSEGFVSLRERRRFLGFELKPSYYAQAVLNVSRAKDADQSLFVFNEACDV